MTLFAACKFDAALKAALITVRDRRLLVLLRLEETRGCAYSPITDVPLSPNGAFDKPISQAQIVADVSPFIASLNGGRDPSKPLKNDVDILNFALLLEYLEATYYDINVPKFFG